MTASLILVAIVVTVTGALYWLYPDTVRDVFETVATTRRILFGVFGIVVAIVLLGSGSPLLMLVGALGVAYGVVWLLVEQPYETVFDGF